MVLGNTVLFAMISVASSWAPVLREGLGWGNSICSTGPGVPGILGGTGIPSGLCGGRADAIDTAGMVVPSSIPRWERTLLAAVDFIDIARGGHLNWIKEIAAGRTVKTSQVCFIINASDHRPCFFLRFLLI
ncbi:hypothetical protein AAY473_034354 [Plecturocebus cupreus]